MPTFNTGHQIGGNMESTDTISSTVGEVRRATTGLFRYGKANVALTAGQVCFFSKDGNWVATKADTAGVTILGPVGVAQNDIAAGQYGWFFIGEGTFRVLAAAGVAVNAKLTTTAVAGTAGTGGTLFGAVATSAAGASPEVINAFAPSVLTINPYV